MLCRMVMGHVQRPVDLVIMSCSTGGMITWFADDRMQRFALPPPPMPLGAVRLLLLIRAEHVVRAAPVRGYESASEALGCIYEEFTGQPRKASR